MMKARELHKQLGSELYLIEGLLAEREALIAQAGTVKLRAQAVDSREKGLAQRELACTDMAKKMATLRALLKAREEECARLSNQIKVLKDSIAKHDKRIAELTAAKVKV